MNASSSMISFSRPYGWLSMRIRRSSLTTSRSFAERVARRCGAWPSGRLRARGRAAGTATAASPRTPSRPRSCRRCSARRRRDHRRVAVGLDVLRALEHQVLEEVGEAGAPRLLVLRPDVVPELQVDDRRRVVLEETTSARCRASRSCSRASADESRRRAAPSSTRAGPPRRPPPATIGVGASSEADYGIGERPPLEDVDAVRKAADERAEVCGARHGRARANGHLRGHPGQRPLRRATP